MAKKEVREKIELLLGKKMHQIGKEQDIFVASQKRLKTLQAEANKLDDRLSKIDG